MLILFSKMSQGGIAIASSVNKGTTWDKLPKVVLEELQEVFYL